MSLLRRISSSLLLMILSTSNLPAASLYRCTDPQGGIHFSQQGCVDGQSGQLEKMPLNPSPGPAAQSTFNTRPFIRKTARATQNPKAKQNSDPLLIIGQSEDGCGNQLSDRERRLAILQKRIRPHMTQKNVESALGSPQSTQSNGHHTTYYYRNGKQLTHSITFDEHGCVLKSKKSP